MIGQSSIMNTFHLDETGKHCDSAMRGGCSASSPLRPFEAYNLSRCIFTRWEEGLVSFQFINIKALRTEYLCWPNYTAKCPPTIRSVFIRGTIFPRISIKQYSM